MIRRRLDAELVRRGLAPSRTAARELVDGGRVRVGGAVADKVARQVGADESLVVVGPPPRFVSRGGLKLEAALDRFGIDVTGWRVLDAGASTGGFTDCLLQRGAASVVAVDVGHGQLHHRLRSDPRVEVHERCNARDLDPSTVGTPCDAAVADLSFISLTRVLAPIAGVCRPGALAVLLVKPQFEAGRAEASRGRGVISDPAIWRRTLGEVMSALTEGRATIIGAMCSPLRGAEGNVEFLVAARQAEVAGADAPAAPDVDALADAAVAEASSLGEAGG